jgi:hypothetical protein
LARHCWCHMATPVELNPCFPLNISKLYLPPFWVIR